MSCDQVREKLIDLVYDELAGPDRQTVERHVAECTDCAAELRSLRAARAALAAHRGAEPGPMALPTPAARIIRFPFRRVIPAVAGVAAMVLVAFAIWMLQVTVPPVVAAEGPVEIDRTDVSLTILSTPENWPGGPVPLRQARREQQRVTSSQARQRLIMPPQYGWQGMALVRDQRLVRNLPQGVTQVKFTDVPVGILPDTVRLRSLDDPKALSILEQNYQYDLASAEAVLEKHVDKPITVVFKDGESASGTLLSFDGRTLVIRVQGAGPRSIERERVKAVSFAKLPEDLLTRPTLLWHLQNAAARQQSFEVAYMTRGITWRADYVLKLRPAAEPKGWPIIDAADLVGYSTVTNNSGVTYEDAQLKLMAGDVNLIRPPILKEQRKAELLFGDANAAPKVGFQEKSFFEYHLYTLRQRTTIRSAETKQIELVSGSGLQLKRVYVYDMNVNRTAARVWSEFENSEKNGLGKPLPKGAVRLYAPGPDGVQTYVAKTQIDHTPVKETIRLPWGYAFDIVCSSRQSASRRSGDDYAVTQALELRNHKDYDVRILVVLRVPAATYEGKCNRDFKWTVPEVGRVEIDVPVKASAAEKLSFSYRYNYKNGGGLKAPGAPEPRP